MNTGYCKQIDGVRTKKPLHNESKPFKSGYLRGGNFRNSSNKKKIVTRVPSITNRASRGTKHGNTPSLSGTNELKDGPHLAHAQALSPGSNFLSGSNSEEGSHQAMQDTITHKLNLNSNEQCPANYLTTGELYSNSNNLVVMEAAIENSHTHHLGSHKDQQSLLLRHDNVTKTINRTVSAAHKNNVVITQGRVKSQSVYSSM